MTEDREQELAEQEAERAMRAKVHRWLGMLATLLVVVAVGVAIWRLDASLEESGLGLGLGESLVDSLRWGLPWVAGVILVGVLFSLGTTRIMLGLEKLWGLVRGTKKADR